MNILSYLVHQQHSSSGSGQTFFKFPAFANAVPKAVLTVVKTFAEEQDETNQYSEEFKKELDSRYEEYINGGKLISEEEANKRIKKIIKPNSIIAALKEHESIKTSIVKK